MCTQGFINEEGGDFLSVATLACHKMAVCGRPSSIFPYTPYVRNLSHPLNG